MANLVSRDIRSSTGSNLRMIQETIGMSVWTCTQSKIKAAIIEHTFPYAKFCAGDPADVRSNLKMSQFASRNKLAYEKN